MRNMKLPSIVVLLSFAYLLSVPAARSFQLILSIEPINSKNESGEITEKLPEKCNQLAERGFCRALLTRFAYDSVVGDCTEFIYGGCGGNENNFHTQEECRMICSGAQLKKPSSNDVPAHDKITVDST